MTRSTVCLMLAVALVPSAVTGQPRPFQNDLADLSVYDTWLQDHAAGVEPGQEQDRQRLRLDGRLEVAPHTELGLDRETGARLHLGGRIVGGLEASPLLFARADLELSAPITLSGASVAEELGHHGLIGRHHVWGRAGLGRPREGALGGDLTLDYRLEHAPDRAAFRRPEIGPAPYVDQTIDARLWVRRGLSDALSWTLPFGYSLRRVDYTAERPGLAGFVTHELSSSLGLRVDTDETVEGWTRLVGLSWSRTRFDAGVRCDAETGFDALSCGGGLPATPDSRGFRPGGLNQIALRFGQLDPIVVPVEPSILLTGKLMFGGSWLWDESNRREALVFETGFGLGTRIVNDALRYGFGVSFTRLSGFTPNGEHLVAHNRFEHTLELSSPTLAMGFAHTGTFDWVAHPEIDPSGLGGLPDPVANTRLYTEWFTDLDYFELGVYHRAEYGPLRGVRVLDPWDEHQVWSHELGGFLRVRGAL